MSNSTLKDSLTSTQVVKAGQTYSTNLEVGKLCELALSGLVPMFEAEKQLFCFRRKRTAQGLVREGLSHRYTLIALLGLRQCEITGLPSPIDIGAVLGRLLQDPVWIDNIGDLGLLLWLCALASPEHLKEVHASLVVKGVLERFREPREGRTTELAWFLSGLAHATLVVPQQAPDLRGLAFGVYGLLGQNQSEMGIFRHLGKRTLTGLLRGRLGDFADQVYPIYALTQFARAFNVQAALEMAHGCAEAITRLQGPQGQWWWLYDSSTGRVFGKYPVYSVHQHGMAPMALFALAEATGLDFTEPIYKGLLWITGKNELSRELRDETAGIIWRGIHHRNKFKDNLRKALSLYGSKGDGESLDDLEVDFECRPYELGWLLYALAGRAPAAGDDTIPLKDARAAALKLLAYCKANHWAGYDPYDALNSRVLAALPFLNSRLPQLVLTQALKQSPINLRRLLLIPKTQNPKAVGLFLSALLKLSRIGVVNQEGEVAHLIERLICLRSPGIPYSCWGYSFPWQTRYIVVPRGAPNLVCTTFVANALLDAYEQRQESRCLSMAVSAGEYILNELYWCGGGNVAGFSYPLPSIRVQIHNANLLAAALLCRLYKQTGEKKFLGPALAVARHSVAQQRTDGSWTYGETPAEQWIDNFHTGYLLCALRSISRSVETREFDSCIERGFEFYRAHFFRQDGAVRYFYDRPYPIDVHCVAQSILTLLTLRDVDPGNVSLARSVLRWALNHLWDERGFFYYQVHRFYTIRASYMRWSQAWMLLALATLLSEPEMPAQSPRRHDSEVALASGATATTI